MIRRPPVEYNDKKHTYMLNGEKLAGVSSIAKIGDLDVWGVASAWAFRIGYEGAFDVVANESGCIQLLHGQTIDTKDELRELLKAKKLTPWSKTKKAQQRGTAIHDALEALAQKGEVPSLEDFPAAEHGYVQALCRWYLDYQPEFVATEVQVVSEKHKFAGRYDLRCKLVDPRENLADKLCLIDLKTSKRVYPTTHFPQLAGYELASREMGFPSTDAQYVLNVREDGSYDLVRSKATTEDFLAYLAAFRAIQRIKDGS